MKSEERRVKNSIALAIHSPLQRGGVSHRRWRGGGASIHSPLQRGGVSHRRWRGGGALDLSIQKNAAPEVFPSAAHYWKFIFLVCSFPLRRIAVTGSCFLLFYFVFVSRRFPDIRIVYRLVICALTFFLANRFHCPYDNVLLKALIVFFSPEAGFTTMASFFLSTNLDKISEL